MKKILVAAASVLIGASFVAAGMAGWVIASHNDSTAGGNVTADTVTEQNAQITVTSNGDIEFMPKAEVDGAWLSASGEVDENLTVEFELELKGVKRIEVKGLIVDEFGGAEESQNWTQAVGYGFVQSGFTLALSGTDADKYQVEGLNLTAEETADMGTTYHVTVTATFAWGDHFDKKNPIEYYKDKNQDETREGGYSYEGTFQSAPGKSVTYGEDAYASLTELRTLLSGLHYAFTFTGYSQ